MRKKLEDKVAPEPGPCGGATVWNAWPRRHWCKMTEEEVAMYLLAGKEIQKEWRWPDHKVAWKPPFPFAFQPLPGHEDGVLTVRFHGKCPWVKKMNRKESPMIDSALKGTKRRVAAKPKRRGEGKDGTHGTAQSDDDGAARGYHSKGRGA